ncbi:glycosyltransferase family 2 protein [Neobacillus niacini]|uniref:glycosyltransferase family 2 protein n=1 Tax=Neobacillus niacini TaxID=86668 RepID=UPI00203D56BA|nr:glycosyltransferase family 2 protein [Neobacillus niacini]MCM3693177.1 glycosyltransferase [Neobacillus niacini]
MDISVVIPTYNRAGIIKESIKSVLDQTLAPLEIIIVDDFSTDNTKDVIDSFNNPKIKYVLNKFSKGANGARNTGIKLAQGTYIAFQDSDDIWLPNKLELQIKYMIENPEVDMCFCSLNIINGPRRIVPKRKVQFTEIEKELRKNNFISTQAIFIKKEVAMNTLFDEELLRFQDWDFCLRVAKSYTIGHLDSPLVDVEVQSDSITKKVNGLEAFYQLINRHPEIANADIANKSLYNKVLFNRTKKDNKFESLMYFTKYVIYKVFEKTFIKVERV